MGPYDVPSTRFQHIEKFYAEWPDWKHGGGLVKSHCDFDLFKSHFPKAKVVYVLRDPRDTLVSFYHYLNHAELYRTNPGLLSQRCDNFPEFLRRPLSDYLRLGFFKNPDFDNVVGRWASHVRGWRSSPNIVVVRFEELRTDFRPAIRRVCKSIGLRPRLLMSEVPFGQANAILPRKGIVGDWKTHFSSEDLQFLYEQLDRFGVTLEGNLK